MEAISLKKVTAVVLTCVIGSYFANANENDAKVDMKTEVKKTEVKVITEAKALSKFEVLVEKFDLNKDGLLSKAEIQTSKSEKLLALFSKIDLNTESGISEAEFNQYLAKIK